MRRWQSYVFEITGRSNFRLWLSNEITSVKIFLTTGLILGLSAAVFMWLRPNLNFYVKRSTQSWGGVVRDRSVSYGALNIGGRIYAHGLGTHANSQITLQLRRSFSRFEGACGVDAETGRAGSIRCKILVGVLPVFKSSLLRGGDPAARFSIALNGANSVKLVVEDGGDGIASDHADWVDFLFVP